MRTSSPFVSNSFAPRVVTAAALLLAFLPGAARGASEFRLEATGVSVPGQVVLLGIDDQLLPWRENLGLYLSEPNCRPEPVLRPSRDDPAAPDAVAAHFYGSVIQEGGRFRMWYYAIGLKGAGDPARADPAALTQGPVCYAESADGLTWTKPALGQVTIHGSARNNAVDLPDRAIEGVHVIRDAADPDPARRFKMVYNAHDGSTWVIRTATSGDGVRWKPAPRFAIEQFLETASLYRFNGLFVVSGQRLTFSEGGHLGGRQGRAIISPDFDHWLPGDTPAFLLPEPAAPELRGPHQPYDQVHLGVGAASFGSVAVGLYGIWHNATGDEDARKRWGWFGYGRISCDLGLVISDDGVHFREPVIGRVFLSHLATRATPVPGRQFPTILTQSGNGILNVGNETRIYFGRWLNAAYGEGYGGEVALATLPRDRWGALGLYPQELPQYHYRAHGSVWSAPVRLPAGVCRVALNAEGADGLAVEVSRADFALLPGFSGAKRGTLAQAAGLDCPVTWPAGDLAALAGETVRFKIDFERRPGVEPRLFAAYLRAE